MARPFTPTPQTTSATPAQLSTSSRIKSKRGSLTDSVAQFMSTLLALSPTSPSQQPQSKSPHSKKQSFSPSKTSTLPPLPALTSTSNIADSCTSLAALTLKDWTPRATTTTHSTRSLLSSSGVLLPTELWLRILSFVPDLSAFNATSTSCSSLLRSPHFRHMWLQARFGTPLAIYAALVHFPRLVSREVLEMLVNAGSNVQRFLVQMAFRDFLKGLNSGPCIYLDFLITEYCRKRGYKVFGVDSQSDDALNLCRDTLYTFPNGLVSNMPADRANILCFGNDADLFEQLLNRTTPTDPQTALHNLIILEHFIPIVETSPTSLFRIFQLSQLNISLLDKMIHQNGFQVSKVNDPVLRRVVACTIHNASSTQTTPHCPNLREYLSRGFKFTRSLVKSILLDSNDPSPIIETLKPHISTPRLRQCALDLTTEMLGPSGTVTFHPLLLTQLLATSLITRNDIQRALITRTKGTGVKESTRIVLLDERIPYTTRCYEQTQPYRVWLWVLSEFGASHVLTQYCFDDLLQWVGESCAGGTGRGDVELNGVVAPFLEAGVSVLPRHVQFLGRAARWKWVAPLPAVVMSVAFRGIVQRIERGKSGGVERVEEERYGARASASVGAHKRGSTSRDRISSRNSSAFTSPTSPASNTTARNVVWWGDAQRLDPSPPSSTTRSKPQTGSLDYTISPILSESPSIPTTPITPVTPTAPNETVSDAELHLWIEALKSLFADQATIHSIKHADAEWFKDYKQEMEAQDRKELLSVGIPLKKSWSGGGLAKRQSEFGSGWWDMLIGIGGNGAMSGRVKALGARTAGRPGRFLEVSQEMLKKLTLAVKK